MHDFCPFSIKSTNFAAGIFKAPAKMKNEIQSRTVFALLHLKKVHTVNTGIHCKFALAQTGIFTQLFSG